MRVRSALTVAVVALGGLVSGCSDDEPSDDPGAGPSPSESTTSPEPTESPGQPGSETPTSDPEAATGKLIELDGVSFRIPDDFTVVRQGKQVFNAQGPSVTPTRIGVVVNDNIGGSYSLRYTSREYLRYSGYRQDPTLREPVVVDDTELYHLSGKTDSTQYVDVFGSGAGEYTYSIAFEFFPDVGADQRQDLVDSVLATVDFE